MEEDSPEQPVLELTESRRERIQERVTRAVICGEPEETLGQVIQANQLAKNVAEEMIGIARKERLRIIRDHYMRYLRLGSFLMALGMAAIYGVLLLAGFRIPTAEYLGMFISAMGLALVLYGLAGILGAPRKKGSYADKA